jgi:hypothetical protein
MISGVYRRYDEWITVTMSGKSKIWRWWCEAILLLWQPRTYNFQYSKNLDYSQRSHSNYADMNYKKLVV